MTYNNNNMLKSTFYKLFKISTTGGPSKLFRWILVALFMMFIFQFSQVHLLSFSEFSQLLTNSYIINSILSFFGMGGSPMSSTSSITTTTTVASEIVIIDNRIPSYKLAIKFNDKPFSAIDLGQGRLLDDLHLHEVCQKDPSKIVVDVGAKRGDFGIYAAACGCTVYFFEIQSDMVKLIRSSIEHNSFSLNRVRIYQNAVSDLPSDSTIDYKPGNGTVTVTDDPIQIATIRLDDVPWSSPSIFLLSINVEGSELSVLRSAKTLFAKRSIQHLMFEYIPWVTNRDPMDQLIPYLRNELKPKFVYVLYPNEHIIHGPLLNGQLSRMYDEHRNLHIQTTVYAVFDKKARPNSIKSQPYQLNRP